MIYLRNTPAAAIKTRPAKKKLYQYRAFIKRSAKDKASEDIEGKLSSDYVETSSDDRDMKIFLVPGREGQMAQMRDDEVFEIRSKIDEDDTFEVWEKSVRTEFPMKRSTASIIAARLPRFAGSLSPVATAKSLTTAMQKRGKLHHLKMKRRLFQKGAVVAEVAQFKDAEEQSHKTIALRSESREQLSAAVSALGLDQFENTNYGDYLRAQ